MEPLAMSAQSRRTLEKARAEIDSVKAECARARRAGIPCEEAEALLAEAERVRDSVLREYGPTAKST